MQTGSVIDFYDDPSGTVLKTKLAYAQLPAYIRQADYQSEEKLAALPDDAFALVMVDQGQKIRKFACVDKGNTALSTLYFLENKDKLPEEAQKVAAANLVEYCQAFEIEPPWQLQKEAVNKSGLLGRLGKSLNVHAHEHPYSLASGAYLGGYVAHKTLHKGREAGKTKESDLTGSAIMPLQSNPNKEADVDSQLKATDEKRAGLVDRITMMKNAPGKVNALKDFEKGVQPQLAKKLHVDTSGKFPPPPPSGWFSLKSASLDKRAGLKRVQRLLSEAMKDYGPYAKPKGPVADAALRAAKKLERRAGKAGLSMDQYTRMHGDFGPESTSRQEVAERILNLKPMYIPPGVSGASMARKTKTSALYVDITGKSPPPQFEKRAHSRYCLEKLGQGRFPIDSYGEVLEANKWFEENGKSLHPQDRREYCTKLAARAGELHISVTDNIRKYAGKNFAPADDVRASVCTRMQFWVDDAPERDALKGMLDKYASASPDQFCQELTAFDVQHGLDQYWDDFIIDPVACVFGMEKTAEWLWEQGADRLTQDLLDVGVHDSQKIHAIKAKFGPELASELVEKPSEVFDSLPLDSKRIIARILNDTQ